ncbi:MAG TPA: hypothetical protein DDZ65_07990 [Firmicutes bacterium]|nr:hypothetical protein [Bacillota bacterium]
MQIYHYLRQEQSKKPRFIGDGLQTDRSVDYVKLERNDATLDIKPKDQSGNPVAIEDFDKLIVYHNRMELKVWQTVLEYANNL